MTDWEFVFDGVVGYLQSPLWNLPIVTFIEKNCIVFEPNDENELQHMEIHKEYSALVEELLTSYLKDVGITEEQFVHACEVGSSDGSPQEHRSIFEQVWAGEDFNLFKKIMIQKNVDMELQVLRMIQQRNGAVPPAFDPESSSTRKKKSKSSHRIDEEQLMQEVMRQSQQEYEKEKERRKDIERMEKSLALSKEESERLHDLAERELNELERMVTLSLKLEKHRENDKEKEKSDRDKKKTKQSPDSRTKSTSHMSKGHSSSPTERKHSPKPSKETTKSDTSQTKQPTATKQKTEKAQRPEASSPKAETSRKSSPTQKSEDNKKEKLEAKTDKNRTSNPKSQQPTAQVQASTEKSSPTTQAPLLKGDLTPREAANNWLLSAKAECATTSSGSSAESKGAGSTKDDEMERAKHMRRLREQLQQRKEKERAKQLLAFEEAQPVKRPKSSRVARRVVAGKEAPNVEKTEAEKQAEKKSVTTKAVCEKLQKLARGESVDDEFSFPA